jgi:preprotein translocase subunit Sss1
MSYPMLLAQRFLLLIVSLLLITVGLLVLGAVGFLIYLIRR